MFVYYDIREHNLIKLGSALSGTDWTDVTDCTDTSTMYDKLVSRCQTLIDQHIPKRKVTLGNKDPHFVSPLVKTLLRKRNKVARKGRASDVALLNDKISKLIAENRKRVIDKANSGDTKALWRAVRSVSGRSKKLNLPPGLDVNKINTFFADIATDNSYDISGPIKFDWDSAADHDSYSHPNSLEPFSTHAVRHYLSKLKKTASGFDGLPY